MSDKKTTTVSLGNTPVQRALRRAKRSSLLVLFVLGILAGFVYKSYFQDNSVADPATATRQR